MSDASPLDVVLGRATDRTRKRSWTVGAAWLFAVVVHGALAVVALRSGPSLEAWSAELALEVHEALVDDQVIELATPTAPEPPPPPRPAARQHAAPAPATPRTEAQVHELTETPAAPTQAAEVVTQDNVPVDLTGSTIVTGSGTTSLGGATAATGQNTQAPSTPTAAQASSKVAVTARALSRPVQLDAAAWRCDWPREAISAEVYEQAVVLRVVVLADGRVEAAQLIEDPGNGFGPAALACAKRTRFSPALDESGAATRALSPPIVVRFTR